eukprot:NODE_48_length_2735_cov_382.878258_g42_i0.p1 GENE.NODE_48_length_2735_cov_382.878258_g42_i0~~NODE_48_length_2735_cov_382.878258_g42_i0.p1  ORF type:complete len:666 (+),score=113.29 NODE_48_length_2735_cov_382.878258_g42_i0:281-2278(+)
MNLQWVVCSLVLSVCLFTYVWFSARYATGADIAPASQMTQLRAGAIAAVPRRPREDATTYQKSESFPVSLERISAGRGARCEQSGICDRAPPLDDPQNCQPGPDGLGCLVAAEARLAAVKKAVSWSWGAYERCAWGHDELQPLSCSSREWMGAACTILDSLDTLLLADMHQEVARAIKWLHSDYDLSKQHRSLGLHGVSFFETTIRALGGPLAAHALLAADESRQHEARTALAVAVDVGIRLLSAWQRDADGLPAPQVNLVALTDEYGVRGSQGGNIAEAGTCALEFTQLSRVTGWAEVAKPAESALRAIAAAPGTVSGLTPAQFSVNHTDGTIYTAGLISFGAYGDSYFEYLLKQYLFTGKTDQALLDAYKAAMHGVRLWLLGETSAASLGGLMYVGLSDSQAVGAAAASQRAFKLSTTVEHLACFMPGLLALGHIHGIETGRGEFEHSLPDLALAERLMSGCYAMYTMVPTGLSPDSVDFVWRPAGMQTAQQNETGGGHFTFRTSGTDSVLRPETVESLFVLWRATGKQKYRDWGWNIFRAFEMHARLAGGGYATVADVRELPTQHTDHMESFFIAETLKYLLLLFSDESVLPLDEWVFNTEAHPFPLPGSGHEMEMRSTYLRAPTDLDLRAQRHSPVALQQAIDHFKAQLPTQKARAGSAAG